MPLWIRCMYQSSQKNSGYIIESPDFLDLFLSSDASICSTILFPPLRNSDHVFVSVFTDFPLNTKWDAPFHRLAYDYSHADWDSLRDHLRDVPCEAIFKLSTSATASEFCEWIQVGINVYIPHCKYQINPHSSPWFSTAGAAGIVHRNHLFRLFGTNIESKGKFRQASNCYKSVFETAKLAYANKTNESITSHKLGSQDFWQIVIVLSAKLNLLYFKTFLRTLILMTLVSLYPFSLLELIWMYLALFC